MTLDRTSTRFALGLALTATASLAGCNDPVDPDITSSGQGGAVAATQGSGGAGGATTTSAGAGGAGGQGGAAPVTCLDASEYADAFTLKDDSLCVVARHPAPFVVGFDENFVEIAPTWGRHGGPLTLAQSGTTFTLTRWKLPATPGGPLEVASTVGPVDTAIDPKIAPKALFLNAAAVDLPFGNHTAIGWADFGTPNGEVLFVGPKDVERRFGISGVYAVAGLSAKNDGRFLSASLSAFGTTGSTVGLYANDLCGGGATRVPCLVDSGSVVKGLVTKAGDASGPVVVDRDGNAFAVFPDLAAGKQKLVGYAASTIAPGQTAPAATELATLDGSGTALAAMAPSGDVDGVVFFQPATMFVPGDVVMQRYRNAGDAKVEAVGSPEAGLVPKNAGTDVRLMSDDAGRLWAAMRVDATKSESAFFLIDRKPTP